MNLLELIQSIEMIDDNGIIFAELIDGKYEPTSEAIILEMSDEELFMPTSEIAKIRCPGKNYFLEAYIVKEMIKDLMALEKPFSFENACKRIISYAVNDA